MRVAAICHYLLQLDSDTTYPPSRGNDELCYTLTMQAPTDAEVRRLEKRANDTRKPTIH